MVTLHLDGSCSHRATLLGHPQASMKAKAAKAIENKSEQQKQATLKQTNLSGSSDDDDAANK